MSKKYRVVWDLETTGLDPKESKITEIGCLVIQDSGETEKRSWLLNHNIEIPEFITKLTGIDKPLLDKEGRDPQDSLIQFINILLHADEHITHNGVRFDIPFLAESANQILGDQFKEVKSYLLPKLYKTAYDTAVEYKANKQVLKRGNPEPYEDFAERVFNYQPGQMRFSLDYCLADANIVHNMERHRAMPDVLVTYELYKHLVSKKDQKTVQVRFTSLGGMVIEKEYTHDRLLELIGGSRMAIEAMMGGIPFKTKTGTYELL